MTRSPTSDPRTAWKPFEAGRDGPWDRAGVAHLHRRAGFLAPWETLERDLHAGPAAAVDRLLAGEDRAADGQTPGEFADWLDGMAAGAGSLPRLQGTWLYRMILTPHPLRERLTLFWHGHFATSDAKVNDPRLMAAQNALIRANCLGDFRAMLDGMARDPAMLTWLDSEANRKGHPNENFAREVMELFTLGRGRYTEKDVQEAARAFTGATVSGGRYRDVPAQHDDGPKTILGQTGRHRGPDVVRILLDQPGCATFLCGKLFRHFVAEVDPPDAGLIAPLADAFRAANYDIKVPVEMILRSRRFHDPATRRKRVKGPVEYAVGMLRALEVVRPTVAAEALAGACTRMGQALFAPPSVAGWEGGATWINTSAMLARSNLALALLSASDAALGKRLDPGALVRRHGADGDPAAFFCDLLGQDGFDPALRDRARAGGKGDPRALLGLILTTPEFQLA